MTSIDAPRTRGRTPLDLRLRIHTIKNMSGPNETESLKAEYSILKERLNQLEDLLIHDPHTGLPVRRIMEKRMRELLETAGKSGEKIGFGILRLDRRYARIRHTRDKMKVFLYMTAVRVKNIIGEENLYQSDRIDEFLMIIRQVESREHLQNVAEEISATIQQPHEPPATDVSFGCHIGMSMFPDHGATTTELIINAEIALGVYETRKEQGAVYTAEIGSQYHENLNIEAELYEAIRKGLDGFHAVYQPIVDKNLNTVACEALMRWDSSRFGSVPPSRFIPIAEDNGKIIILGRWMLYNALRQIKKWKDTTGQDISVSVNMSPRELLTHDFVSNVNEALTSLKLKGKSLFLEVTESTLMDDPDISIEKFKAFQELGIDILLDDFGTGYSSLEYLSRLPIDTLKIAKPFVDKMHDSSKSLEIIRTIIAMSKNFGYKTLAEGVETQRQLDDLLELGCEYIQGFIVSPPVDSIEFELQFLQKNRAT